MSRLTSQSESFIQPDNILFLMCYSEASERCQAEKRKTINGEDILFAMSTLGLDNYVEPLKLYLQKYREAMKGERQIESELTGMGGDVMTAQQLQV